MEIVRDWRGPPATLKGAAVAIGAFDGVHRGHQAVIAEARAAAERLGAPLGVVSFDPHPRRWFQPDAEPFRLMSTDQMARALAGQGVQRLYNADWDREWLPEEERKSTLVFIGVDLPEEEIRGRIGGLG